MKLVKVLQTQGLGSRKGCAWLIRRGHVAVDGKACTDPDAEFDVDSDPAGLRFSVEGVEYVFRARAYLMLNKPAGVECSRSPTHHASVFGLIPDELVARGVQPVGRLDQDTTGLLLLSDDGKFIHRLISPKHKVPKVYEADCATSVTDEQLAALTTGVTLRGEPDPFAAVSARRLGEQRLELVLTEGKYHQVKRMVVSAGNHVERLHRARIGGLELGDLAPGEWRWLEADDLAALDQEGDLASPGEEGDDGGA